MLFRKACALSLTACFLFGSASTRAQDAGALLDLLVRKKVITDQEAEEVRAELTKEVATTSAGKWKLSTPITELEIYGDARLRYEYRGGRTAGDTPVAAPGVCKPGALRISAGQLASFFRASSGISTLVVPTLFRIVVARCRTWTSRRVPVVLIAIVPCRLT